MSYTSIDKIGEYVGAYQRNGKIAVITDENVAGLYLKRIAVSLTKAGFTGSAIIIPPGEEYKNGKTYLSLLDRLVENDISREDGIIALGGGVITDLAGFAAATYMRGVNLYNVPTTLMGMVDASIGGKNGIDIPAGKNMAGTFYEPCLIIRDISLLESIAEEQFRDGMAEIIKYALIGDELMFDVIEGLALGGEVITGINKSGSILENIVDRCAKIKEEYVLRDKYDYCTRRMLNFGHTVGHAIESLSGYMVSHGAAVAAGMNFITGISAKKGWCDDNTAMRIEGLLNAYGFDLDIPFSSGELVGKIRSDKKRSGDNINIITPDKIGKCRIMNISIDEFERLCAECLGE